MNTVVTSGIINFFKEGKLIFDLSHTSKRLCPPHTHPVNLYFSILIPWTTKSFYNLAIINRYTYYNFNTIIEIIDLKILYFFIFIFLFYNIFYNNIILKQCMNPFWTLFFFHKTLSIVFKPIKLFSSRWEIIKQTKIRRGIDILIPSLYTPLFITKNLKINVSWLIDYLNHLTKWSETTPKHLTLISSFIHEKYWFSEAWSILENIFLLFYVKN